MKNSLLIIMMLLAIGCYESAKAQPIQTIEVVAKRPDSHLKKIEAFVIRMHDLYQFDKDELRREILAQAPSQDVLSHFKKKKKKKGEKEESPEEIAFKFERRVNHGVEFWFEHKDTIAK